MTAYPHPLTDYRWPRWAHIDVAETCQRIVNRHSDECPTGKCGVSLVFTMVMDELSRGLADYDEEVRAATDRAFWKEKGSRGTVAVADELLTMIQGFDPEVQFKYKKFYIGFDTRSYWEEC